MRKYISVFFSVVAAVMAVALVGYAATTISTNVNTGGTLTVSGASTLTGNVSAAGTLAVTGATTLTGLGTFDGGFISTASSTAGAAFNVTGLSTFGYSSGAGAGTGGFVSKASSTVVGTFNTTNSVGIATTTPTGSAVSLSVGGDLKISASTTQTIVNVATTTVFINSSVGGSCIQFNNVAASTTYRMFINSAGTSTVAGTAGTILDTNGLKNLVIEQGACKN